jgi:PBP1b-binding outer membrane lipoprotein LpoB
MKTVMVVIGFGLLLVGCGQGPAVVTVKDANSSETTTQAKTKEPIEAQKP